MYYGVKQTDFRLLPNVSYTVVDYMQGVYNNSHTYTFTKEEIEVE